MNDPILGILTCRLLALMHPDNKKIPELLNKIYDEFFISRGEENGDIYLKSIGLWAQEKFIPALNAL